MKALKITGAVVLVLVASIAWRELFHGASLPAILTAGMLICTGILVWSLTKG